MGFDLCKFENCKQIGLFPINVEIPVEGHQPIKAVVSMCEKHLDYLQSEKHKHVSVGFETHISTRRFEMGSSNINHPKHYNQGKIEVIEFIEDKNLGFNLGNAVKYISRAGIKDPNKEVEDLEKAVWYLRRQIELVKCKEIGVQPTRPNDMNPLEPTPTPTNGKLVREGDSI